MVAIIIPAYKLSFIEETLASIAAQTDKRFHVYVGDDASPENIYAVIAKFKEHIPITYKRFDTNLGSNSLVGHWHRCIEMSQNEEWFWLFGDDDIMEPECIASFYNAIKEENNVFDVYKFNTQIIDKSSADNGKSKNAPQEIQTSLDFLRNRLAWKQDSYVVEYIFSRKVYLKYGGFPDFKTALASDDAFWALASLEYGIKTIEGPLVKWRNSGQNISSLKSDAEKKMTGALQYVAWQMNQYPQVESIPLKLQVSWLLGVFLHFRDSFDEKSQLKSVLSKEGISKDFKLLFLYKLFVIKTIGIKKRLKRFIKRNN